MQCLVGDSNTSPTNATVRIASATPAIASALALIAGCSNDPAPRHSAAPVAEDSAFAALQQRGADPRAMGVDQYSSVHRFDALPDGGRIELQRSVDDASGIAQIRRHLRDIARAFAAGDFGTPGFVHLRQVPGTAVMAQKRSAISYDVRDLPRGAELRITTHDSAAVAAVHEFMMFQRMDHRAGGADHSPTRHQR